MTGRDSTAGIEKEIKVKACRDQKRFLLQKISCEPILLWKPNLIRWPATRKLDHPESRGMRKLASVGALSCFITYFQKVTPVAWCCSL